MFSDEDFLALSSYICFNSYPFSCQQPANILTSKDFKLTLIDYGNARRIKSPVGT